MPWFTVKITGGGPRAIHVPRVEKRIEARTPHVAASRALAEAEKVNGLRVPAGAWVQFSMLRDGK